MTDPAELEAWNAANQRARAAYRNEIYGCCGALHSQGHRASCSVSSRRSAHHLLDASQLGDKHVGRNVRIGEVEGTLTGIIGRPNGAGVDLAVLVGGARAWFALAPDACVEVWR